MPRTYEGTVSNSSCLVCWEPLQTQRKAGGTNVQKNEALFYKICSTLKIDSSSWTWNFDTETFPFCGNCLKEIQQLIRLHEKLETIKREIDVGISRVRQKLIESDCKFMSTDLRIIGFRSQIFAGQNVCPPQQPSFFPGSSTGPATVVNNAIFPSTLPFHPVHVLSNTVPDVTGFTASNSSINPIHFNYLQNPHHNSRTEDFGRVEYQSGESNNTASRDDGGIFNTEDDSQDMMDDSNDPDYSDLSTTGIWNETTSAKNIKSTKSRSTGRKLSTLKKSEPTAEHFTPLQTTSDGRMFYENIEISKNEKGYVCGKCGYNKVKGHSSITLRKMKIHIKGVHFDAYRCEICKKNFTTSDILNQHTKRVHIVGVSVCQICGRPGNSQPNAVAAHLWTHKNEAEKAEAKELGLEPAEVKYRRKQYAEKKYSCPKCSKKFAEHSTMKNHLKTHLTLSEKKDIKCPQCEAMFCTQSNLRRHISLNHEPDTIVRWFHCPFCENRRFSKKSEQDEHIARKHKSFEEKNFPCSICNKRFGLQVHLNYHLKNHKPIEYFTTECDLCGIKIKNKDALRDHKIRNHPSTRPKKYERFTIDIEEVRKQLKEEEANSGQYNEDGTLKKGWEQFGPFETREDGKLYYEGYEVSKLKGGSYLCVTCGLEFKPGEGKNTSCRADKSVKIHIQGIHLGLYSCNYCGKKLQSKYHLSRHKFKVHYYIKAQCEICGMETEQKHLRSHMWSHKSPEEMVAALNSGEPMPSEFKYLKNTLAQKIDENVYFTCGDCSESFPNPNGLDDHRKASHPKMRSACYQKKSSRKQGTQNNKSKRKLKKHASYESDATSPSESESETDNNTTISKPSPRRNLRSRANKTKDSSDAVVSLSSLPKSLVNGVDIKVVSDQLVSYVNDTGEMKLLTLDQFRKQNNSSESDTSDSESEMFLNQFDCEFNGSEPEVEVEYKIFPDPDNYYYNENTDII